jgi:hypothetical protein
MGWIYALLLPGDRNTYPLSSVGRLTVFRAVAINRERRFTIF